MQHPPAQSRSRLTLLICQGYAVFLLVEEIRPSSSWALMSTVPHTEGKFLPSLSTLTVPSPQPPKNKSNKKKPNQPTNKQTNKKTHHHNRQTSQKIPTIPNEQEPINQKRSTRRFQLKKASRSYQNRIKWQSINNKLKVKSKVELHKEICWEV